MSVARKVSTRSELLEAVGSDAAEIIVQNDIDELPTLRLGPGQSIHGLSRSVMRFQARADGVRLSADNSLAGLTIVTDIDREAIGNDTAFPGFGIVDLAKLNLVGCLRLCAGDAVGGGHLTARDVVVEAADARAYPQRPAGFGVEVIPGAFMIWNQHADPHSTISAELIGIAVGRPGKPVRGSGIFIAGTPGGGRTVVSRLETDEVHSDGGIERGVADRISGGVFVVSGVWADTVRNRKPVTTYGQNDMVLDNWGSVQKWQADAKITSFGPSGIGFVNFGDLRSLTVNATIETFGAGARGFNIYDGTLGDAEFERVITRGDGAVGIQISKPVNRIVVRRGIETFGGVGDSLVKGVVKQLAAIPLSIKPGGSAREIIIDGGLIAHGEGVTSFENHGRVETLSVTGGFASTAGGFESI